MKILFEVARMDQVEFEPTTTEFRSDALTE